MYKNEHRKFKVQYGRILAGRVRRALLRAFRPRRRSVRAQNSADFVRLGEMLIKGPYAPNTGLSVSDDK